MHNLSLPIITADFEIKKLKKKMNSNIIDAIVAINEGSLILWLKLFLVFLLIDRIVPIRKLITPKSIVRGTIIIAAINP